jgi:hypothetical protein
MMSITALCWVDTDTDTGDRYTDEINRDSDTDTGKMDTDRGGMDTYTGKMDMDRGMPLIPRKGVLLSGNKRGTVKLWTLVNTPPS